MTRPIKFRAWDEKKKTFLYYDGYLPPKHYSEDVTQFTGLLDKNGKEIYEGDVLRYGNRDGIVVYDRCTFRWKMDGKWLLSLLARSSGGEIIGDIYSNPELLKS